MKVTIRITGIDEFLQRSTAQVRGGAHGPIHDAFLVWGEIYRSYTMERYSTLSRGGSMDGDSWAPLQESTIRKRRKGKGQGLLAAILIDKGILFAATTPRFSQGSGAIQQMIDGGIRVGYGGPERHPDTDLTIAGLASIHQGGVKANNLPARPIIADPPSRVLQEMANVIEQAVVQEWRRAG